MTIKAFILIWACYAFLVHRLGRLSLRAIVLESNKENELIKYEQKDEILKSWMAIKLLVDFDFPQDGSKFMTRYYIYGFRFSMVAFPFFMAWLVFKYGIE